MKRAGSTSNPDQTTSVVPDGAARGHSITWPEALRVWAYIGLNSFGGPAGQISIMHTVLVEQKRWISEERFLHALNYCMLLPGPEAMQLATYVGWLLHRTLGGLVAGALFVLPGFLSILGLSIAYTAFREIGWVQSALFGLKAAVLAIVIEAVIRIGRRVLKNVAMYAIAAAAFVAIFFFEVPFPFLIAAAALFGWIGGRLRPDLFEVLKPKVAAGGPQVMLATDVESDHVRPTRWRALGVLAVWLPIWLGPVIGLGVVLGRDHVLAAEAEFFSMAAVVTFGGAYAVLAFVAQQAVEVHGWLEPGEMLTGLGMAESTPGPLIQVVQYVGYMGAYRDPGSLPPVLAGTVASILVTWVTFAPCFLWIFLGAPYVEMLRGRPALNAAMSSITASVVGVILNLAVWLGLHTLFSRVEALHWRGVRVIRPETSSVDWPAVAIAVVSAVLLFRMHLGPLRTLMVAVGLSIAWSLLVGLP